jgi:hypothetical protein
MGNKQTAVEAIYELLDENRISDIAEMKPWFMNMEKVQIKKAYESGCTGEVFELNCNESAETYYQKNYGNQ